MIGLKKIIMENNNSYTPEWDEFFKENNIPYYGVKKIKDKMEKEIKDWIDIRVINCSCGKPDCTLGLSFDTEQTGQLLYLRTHYNKGEEIIMQLNESAVWELIEHLQSFALNARKMRGFVA